jgi:cation-transporting P-type ATPase 13A2
MYLYYGLMKYIGVSFPELIIRFLDVYTVAIPPALPISLTVGIVFAVDRLKKQRISCVAPSRFEIELIHLSI